MEIEHWCPICDRQILPTTNVSSKAGEGEDSPLDPPEVSSPTEEEPQTPTIRPFVQNQTKSSRPRQSSPATTRKKTTVSTGAGTRGSRPGLHRSKTTQGNIHHHKRKSAINLVNLGDINLVQAHAMPPVPDDYQQLQQDREVGTAAGAKTSRIGTISREDPNRDAGAPTTGPGTGAGMGDNNDGDGEVVVLRRTRRDRLHSLGRQMKAMPFPAVGPDTVIDENTTVAPPPPPVVRPKTAGKSKTGTSKLRPKSLNLTSAECAALISNDKASTAGGPNEIITPASPVRHRPVPEYLQRGRFCSQECYDVALGVEFPKVHADAKEEDHHDTLSFRRSPGSILSSSTPLIAALLSDGETSPTFRRGLGLRPKEKRSQLKSRLRHTSDAHAHATTTTTTSERDGDGGSKEKSSRRRGEARRHSVAVVLGDGHPVVSIDRPWWMVDEDEDWDSYSRKALRRQTVDGDSRSAHRKEASEFPWRFMTRESSTTVSSSTTRSSSSVATPSEMAISKPLPTLRRMTSTTQSGNEDDSSAKWDSGFEEQPRPGQDLAGTRPRRNTTEMPAGSTRKRRDSRRLLIDSIGLTPITHAKETTQNSTPTLKTKSDSIRRNSRVLPPLLIKTHVCVATSPTTPSKPMLSPTKVRGLSYYAPSSSPEPITTTTGSGSSGEESSNSQVSPRKSLLRGDDHVARSPLLQNPPQTRKPSASTLERENRMDAPETGSSPVVSFLKANHTFPKMLSTLLPRF